MSNTRQLNMQKRRERILSEARKVIAEQGYDAFNLRDLAELAGLTVPTVYNLIGSKDNILKTLIEGAYEELDIKFQEHPTVPIKEYPETITKIMCDLLYGEEDYYRATALAAERMDGREEIIGKTGTMRVSMGNIADSLCTRAATEGLLQGHIPKEMLIDQIVPAFQLTFRDWAYRFITVEEMRIISLRTLYVTLAADATPQYRGEIASALRKL